MEAARVVQIAWEIVTADVREIVECHVGPCRYCWGKGHRFQFTDVELEKARGKHRKEQVTSTFDPQGGGGFTSQTEPHPTCPSCGGAGIARMVLHDTRGLSPGAAQLFAGIKRTKDGVEVKLHSKEAALDKLFRYFGLYKDAKEPVLPLVVVRDFTGKKETE